MKNAPKTTSGIILPNISTFFQRCFYAEELRLNGAYLKLKARGDSKSVFQYLAIFIGLEFVGLEWITLVQFCSTLTYATSFLQWLGTYDFVTQSQRKIRWDDFKMFHLVFFTLVASILNTVLQWLSQIRLDPTIRHIFDFSKFIKAHFWNQESLPKLFSFLRYSHFRVLES